MTSCNLTGHWSGRFEYVPRGFPICAFDARLDDVSGTLQGDITEPNSFRPDLGPFLHAEMIGEHKSGQVTFRKHYLEFDQGDFPVYRGTLDESGFRIEGRWSFRGAPYWSGSFVMVRAPEMTRAERVATQRTV